MNSGDVEEESGFMGVAEYGKLAKSTRLLPVDGKRLLLNPFIHLHGTWFDSEYDEDVVSYPLHRYISPEFPHDILALQFILNAANEAYGTDDAWNSVLAKYKHTAEVFSKMIPAKCIEWAARLYNGFPECADEGYGTWVKL